MHILTTVENTYISIFSNYMAQFMQWGKWIFISLVTINIVWLSIWYAFDQNGFSESISVFIKRFFVISLFYTIMIHPEWLTQLLKTSQWMGGVLTHVPVDPSSLITEGIGIGNMIVLSIHNANILTEFFGVIMVSIAYVIVLFVFLSIALELALVLVMTTALISIASFFLGFAGLNATSQVAKQILEVILANCIKLLGIYLVIGAGHQSILILTKAIPKHLHNFDPYIWLIAVLVFFWLLAKNFPNQLARIISGTIQETQGTDSMALTLSTVKSMQTAISALHTVSDSVTSISETMRGWLAREKNESAHVQDEHSHPLASDLYQAEINMHDHELEMMPSDFSEQNETPQDISDNDNDQRRT